MIKFSRIGAVAMAFALSVSFLAPVNARAMDNKDYTGTATENGSLDETKDYSCTITRKENGKTYTYTKNASGNTYDEAAKDDALRFYVGTPSKVNVGIQEYAKVTFYPEYDEALVSVKIKKGKSNITIKKVAEFSFTEDPSFDPKNNTYYFEKNDGTRAYTTLTEANFTEDAFYALQKKRSIPTYRIFGKKAGTATIEYKIKNEAGKTTKKTIKVVVGKDVTPFKSITYAGKNLLYDYSKGANNSKYIYAGPNKDEMSYTTKASGKFKVTMNKDYKLLAIWVEKSTDWITEADPDRNVTDEDGTSTYSTLVHKKARVDLNGDGDTFDTIDGLKEGGERDVTLAKLSNGKKLVLNKVLDDNSYIKDTYQAKTGKYNHSTTLSSKGNMATTNIHIIYQDKITKNVYSALFPITLRVGK